MEKIIIIYALTLMLNGKALTNPLSERYCMYLVPATLGSQIDSLFLLIQAKIFDIALKEKSREIAKGNKSDFSVGLSIQVMDNSKVTFESTIELWPPTDIYWFERTQRFDELRYELCACIINHTNFKAVSIKTDTALNEGR